MRSAPESRPAGEVADLTPLPPISPSPISPKRSRALFKLSQGDKARLGCQSRVVRAGQAAMHRWVA